MWLFLQHSKIHQSKNNLQKDQLHFLQWSIIQIGKENTNVEVDVSVREKMMYLIIWVKEQSFCQPSPAIVRKEQKFNHYGLIDYSLSIYSGADKLMIPIKH